MTTATSFRAKVVFLPVLLVAVSGCLGDIGATEEELVDSESRSPPGSASSDSGSASSDSGSASSDAGSTSDAGTSGSPSDAGPGAEALSEAKEWLSGHNSRREKYHVMYGGSSVPMKWSATLAASAKAYAEEMARTGVWAHSTTDYGENLAWNGGTQHRGIEDIMTRWVENEEATWGGHFTQVLWRATQYVGCGRASSAEHGSFQACQYVTPGNCGGRSRENMMATMTRCLPQCPPEGCF
jgi:uncharacterized protein YkwD